MRPARGFTLIEVLAVVAIVAVILAVAAVNLMPSDAQVARREAANVALALEHARDAAWFGGRPVAVSFARDHVRQWRFAGGEWRPDAARDARVDGVTFTAMHVDGHALEPGERLLFLPDGLGTPYRVALSVRGHAWAVEGDAAGSVRLVPP